MADLGRNLIRFGYFVAHLGPRLSAVIFSGTSFKFELRVKISNYTIKT